MTYVPVKDTLVDSWVGIGLGVTAEFRVGKTMKKTLVLLGFTSCYLYIVTLLVSAAG